MTAAILHSYHNRIHCDCYNVVVRFSCKRGQRNNKISNNKIQRTNKPNDDVCSSSENIFCELISEYSCRISCKQQLSLKRNNTIRTFSLDAVEIDGLGCALITNYSIQLVAKYDNNLVKIDIIIPQFQSAANHNI